MLDHCLLSEVTACKSGRTQTSDQNGAYVMLGRKPVLSCVIPAVAVFLLLSTPAFATTVTFSVSGGGPGNDDSATAEFNFSGTSLDLKLTNTSTMTSIANILDGFNFAYTGTATAFVLNSVTAGGVVSCTNPGGCVDVSGSNSSPYSWAITDNSPSPVSIRSGGGALHPFGIADDSLLANFGLDGLVNAQHNPMILNDATFHFSFTGAITGITSATFLFGTGPDSVPGTPGGGPGTSTSNPQDAVPEPASLILLGSGLALGARRVRRKLNS